MLVISLPIPRLRQGSTYLRVNTMGSSNQRKGGILKRRFYGSTRFARSPLVEDSNHPECATNESEERVEHIRLRAVFDPECNRRVEGLPQNRETEPHGFQSRGFPVSLFKMILRVKIFCYNNPMLFKKRKFSLGLPNRKNYRKDIEKSLTKGVMIE